MKRLNRRVVKQVSMTMGASTGNKWLTPAILTLFMSSIALGALEFSVVGMQEELHVFFNKSIPDIGLLVTVFAVGVVIGTPIVMIKTAKVNRFKLMFISMALLMAATVLPLGWKEYNVMLVCRFIQAILSGAIVSSSYVLSTDLPAPENKAKAMTLVFAGYSVASVFIIPIVEAVSDCFNVRIAYGVVIALEVIALLMIFLFIPHTSNVWVGKKEDEIALVKDKRIILCILMPMFAVGAIYMVYSYISAIFVEGFEIEREYLHYLLFAFGIMCIISNIISAEVESKGGLKYMKYVFVAQFITLAAISFAMYNINGDDTWPLGVAVVMFMGVIMYIINTPIQSFYLRISKRDYPGGVYLSSCFQSIAFNLGVALGSMFGGHVIHLDNLFNLGYWAAGLTLVAIIIMIVLERACRPEDFHD